MARAEAGLVVLHDEGGLQASEQPHGQASVSPVRGRAGGAGWGLGDAPPGGEEKRGSFPRPWGAGVPHSPFFARWRTPPLLHSNTLFSEVKAVFVLSIF